MSTFDPNAFAQAATSESFSTTMAPIPEGEYTGMIVGPINEQGKTALRTTSKGQLILDVVWQIDDAAVSKATGMEKPTVRQSIFLDTTSDGGLDISPNRNVGLGRLREALGQNKKGQAWKLADIIGQVAKITTKQRMVDDAIYSDVKGVTKL